MRFSKAQLNNPGYCTGCIKLEVFDKYFNHYSGKKCKPDEIFVVPAESKSYKIKDVRNDVLVNFL